MGLRQPYVHGQQPGLRAEPEQRQQECRRRPRAVQRGRAHAVERVVAGTALQHTEAEQDADRADVRDQQVEEARLPDLRDAVLGGDEEVGRQRHRLPRDHEQVGVVGHQHRRHRREERVVQEADEPRRRAFARAEVAHREQRNRRSRGPEDQQEERRQRIEPHVERQVGQAERQDERRGSVAEREEGDDREGETDGRTQREQHAADEAELPGCGEAHGADREPRGDRAEDGVKRDRGQRGVHLGTACAGRAVRRVRVI